MTDFDPALMDRLRPPKVGVPAFHYVVDQNTGGTPVPYDPDAVCPVLQHTILDHFSEPERDEDGYTRWLLVVASRQTTKTSTAVLSLANVVEYTPGAFGLLITDKRERSHTVFRYVSISLENKPREISYPRMPSSKDTRAVTWEHRGKFQTIGANDDNPGIGMAADVVVMSELPFWNDPAGVWSQLGPAFRNRKNSMILMESTPAPMNEPGAEWYKEMAASAASGHSRMDFLFVPFFQSKLNERTWRAGWTLTNDEIRLLERFGPPTGEEPISAPGSDYLTLENLAFMRTALDEDPRIRQAPELFWVWYPKDRVSCWQVSGFSAFPTHAVDRHEASATVSWPRDGFYVQYEDPKPGAYYVIGADPSGWGTGDPAAFVVLEVWNDEWRVVAEYETNRHDPLTFAYHLAMAAKHHNDAYIFIEANGVGAGPITTLELMQRASGLEMEDPLYPGKRVTLHVRNLFYRKIGDLDQKPGVWASQKSIEEAMSATVDGLLERLVIPSEALYEQIRNYRRDKEVAQDEKARVLDPNSVGRRRRPKHHWDRISALMWACWGAKFHAPIRFKPRQEVVPAGTGGAYQPVALTLDFLDERKKERQAAQRQQQKAATGKQTYGSGVTFRKSRIKPSK